jgi:uncharacterized protein YidB (DUF937 family)
VPNQPLSIVEALCSGFCTARLGLNTRISLVQKYGLFCFGPEADAQVGADTRSYLSSGMSRYTSTGTVGRLLGWMGRLRGVGDRNYMSVWVNVGADQDCFAACSGSSFGPASLRSAVQHCCRNVVEQRFESQGIPAKKKAPERGLFLLAGRPGFEPGLAESESAVLPLDDLPIRGVRRGD